MANINLEDWQTESLRLSAFLVESIDPTNMNLWKSLVGHTPEQVHSMPQQQLVKEEGPLLSGWLSVEARNDRIDWRLSQNPKLPPKELPVVGPYDLLQEEFQKLMQRWLTNCLPTHRLGYGAVLLFPAENLLNAYEVLNDLLPTIEIDSKNTHDFHYRINRRRSSHSSGAGMEINRLSTWSAANVSTIGVDISPNKQGIPRIIKSINHSVCRLELDINTAAEFNAQIDKSIVTELFSELVYLGNEIASEGDIP